MDTVSARQRRILDYIKETVQARGYPPTVREIGEAVGLNSSSSVHAQLANLERRGLLRRDPTKPRAMELQGPGAPTGRAVSVPVVGRISAGTPMLADENVEGTLTVARDWVNGDEAFFLKVEGESMINAHILPGDYALVRHQTTAESGEIVVALVNGEATIKRVVFKRDVVILQPEHPSMPPIHVRRGEKSFQIVGKVVGILRKL